MIHDRGVIGAGLGGDDSVRLHKLFGRSEDLRFCGKGIVLDIGRLSKIVVIEWGCRHMSLGLLQRGCSVHVRRESVVTKSGCQYGFL